MLTDQLTSEASDLRFVTRSSMMYYYPMVATSWGGGLSICCMK
jgi:hypothetical protein